VGAQQRISRRTLAAGSCAWWVFRLRRRSWSTLLLVVVLFFGVGWWRGAAMARQMAPYQAFSKQKSGGCGAGAEDGVYGYALPDDVWAGPRAYRGAGANAVAGGLGIRRLWRAGVYRGDVGTGERRAVPDARQQPSASILPRCRCCSNNSS